MKVSTRATVNCSIDAAWEALHTPDVFRRVSAPFTFFHTRPDNPLPNRFTPGVDYEVSVLAAGLIPLGHQVIHLTDDSTDWRYRRVTDTGNGQSGVLAVLRGWHHEMALRARPDGQTDFSDTLRVQAGWLTPLLWLGMRVMWAWRAWRLTRILRSSDSPITRSWNARYASKPALWSGRVNPIVVDTATDLTPGVAVDAGAGEGGDALWLAQQGWRVVALEASAVGIYRGATQQAHLTDELGEALSIDWKVCDLASGWPIEPASADLVSLQFLHTDRDTRLAVWHEAISAVRPGGTLLIVGHDPADAAAGIPRPPAELCFGPEDLEGVIPDSWSSVRSETVARDQVINGVSHRVHDVVIRAVR